MRVHVLTIGNEILSGHTLDTNSNFLAKELTQKGIKVERIVTVPDEVDVIVQEIKRILSEKPNVLLMTGGLGPTWDDITAEAISRAFDDVVELNEEAINHVKVRYEELYAQGLVDTPELLPERRKMALLPLNSQIIRNSVGTAPGIYLKAEDTIIFSMPGVPAEMKPMFLEEVLPKIMSKSEEFHSIQYFEQTLTLDFRDESILAPLLEKTRKKFDVWVKSTPSSYQETTKIPVIISARRPKKVSAIKAVKEATRFIESNVVE